MRLIVLGLTVIVSLASLGTAGQAENLKLSPAQMMQMQTALNHAIRRCLPLVPGLAEVQSATVLLVFNRDNTLAQHPELIATTNTAAGKALIRAATRCLADKSALRFDPRFYDAWREIRLNWRFEPF